MSLVQKKLLLLALARPLLPSELLRERERRRRSSLLLLRLRQRQRPPEELGRATPR